MTAIRPYNAIFSNLPSLFAKQAAEPEVVATGSRVLLIGQQQPQESSFIATQVAFQFSVAAALRRQVAIPQTRDRRYNSKLRHCSEALPAPLFRHLDLYVRRWLNKKVTVTGLFNNIRKPIVEGQESR